MKISIAMTTYNGARYLKEQLESFASQTRLPDELMVCDDASTDHTVEILEDFSRRAPFHVEIVRNHENIGYTENFIKSISHTTGDLIFLCDQDDLWYQNKIECMVDLFDQDTGLKIAIHDCIFFDEDGIVTGGSLLKNKMRFKVKHDNFIHGSCTVITKDLRNISYPLPPKTCGNYGHDDWLHVVGAYIGKRKVVDVPYQLYRRHEMNVSQSSILYSVSTPRYIERYKYLISKLLEFSANSDAHLQVLKERLNAVKLIRKRVNEQITDLNSEQYSNYTNRLGLIENELAERIDLSSHPRSARIVHGMRAYLTGHYKFSSGWRSLLVDLLK